LVLQAVLASPYPPLSALVLERHLDAVLGLPLPEGMPIYVASERVMAELTGYNVHRGVLGLARRLPLPAPEELMGASLAVVVEGVNDQANLGAIFRNAAAFSVGAVLLDPTCADPLYRRSVRVSLGQVLAVPFARLSPWPASLGIVEKCGYVVVALTPEPAAEPIGDVAADLRGSKVALALGAEGPGLSPEVLSMARRARIPMAPGVDSLNVAAATAVALYCFAGRHLLA